MEQLVVMAISGFVVALWTLLLNKWRVPAWKSAAAACGLKEVRIRSAGVLRNRLTARSGSLAVRFEDSGAAKLTRVAVAVPGPPFFPWIKIRPQVNQPAREIEVGDGPFDDLAWIEGPVQVVVALLNAEIRQQLSRLIVQSRLEIVEGELRVVLADHRIPHVLPQLLDLGRRLAQPLDVAQRLGENAQRDPEAGVRLRNLLVLLRELPAHPLTKEALAAACSDRSAAVRLRAAKELGAEGRQVLLDLTESLEDDEVSGQAVARLGRELPFDRTRAILLQALRRRFPQTARACLESLGEHGGPAAVEILAKVTALETGELAVAAAQALGTIGSEAAEAPLVAALDRDVPELRVEAARALGGLGSVAAVPALREAAERFAGDAQLRRAVRQAIAEIQSRLPGATPGQLSLAGAEAGLLSLAAIEAGQLSLAGAEAGQLSLASDRSGQLSLPAGERSR